MRLGTASRCRHKEQAPSRFAQNGRQDASVSRQAQLGVVVRVARDGRKLALKVGDECDLGPTKVGVWPARQSEQSTPVRQPRRRLKELYIAAEEYIPLSAPSVDSHQTLPDIPCMQFATDNRFPVGRQRRRTP